MIIIIYLFIYLFDIYFFGRRQVESLATRSAFRGRVGVSRLTVTVFS